MLGNADVRGVANRVGLIVGTILFPMELLVAKEGCKVGVEDRTELAVVVWIVGAIVGRILCV